MTENSDFWFNYDRTPRDITDTKGELLNVEEEPIKVTMFSSGIGKKYPWGHIQMEYAGQVIDFESDGMRNLKADQPQLFEAGIRHYYIFPSAAGINTDSLIKSIRRHRQQMTGYNLILNNCADQVRSVLEEAGARGFARFAPLAVSVPEWIGEWCAAHGVEIDVRTTNLYRRERKKEFRRLKRMLAYSQRLLVGEYIAGEWLPNGNSGKQMCNFMLHRATYEIRRIIRLNRNDFGTSKVFVDYLRKKCGDGSFLEQYGIMREMRRTLYYRCPEREAAYLVRRDTATAVLSAKSNDRA